MQWACNPHHLNDMKIPRHALLSYTWKRHIISQVDWVYQEVEVVWWVAVQCHCVKFTLLFLPPFLDWLSFVVGRNFERFRYRPTQAFLISSIDMHYYTLSAHFLLHFLNT